MISRNKIASSAQADHYYDHDDYYRESGEAPSRWMGQGAERQRLRGETDRADVRKMLEGRTADGSQLGTTRKGEHQHTPGWDFTVNASKSMSFAALVGGDERVSAAHNAGVSAAVDVFERHAAVARVRENGEVRREHGQGLTIAAFQHATSRSQDAHMHTHLLIGNMVQTSDGQWRSLDSQQLYAARREADRAYNQAAASKLREAGYTVEEGREGAVEIAEVPHHVREGFSSRRAAVDAYLSERGHTRESAPASMREEATKRTRPHKERGADRDKMADTWREQGRAMGFDARETVAAARERAAELDPETLAQERTDAAARAVESATADLEERQCVFSDRALSKRAHEYAAGTTADPESITAAIAEHKESGRLRGRTVDTPTGEQAGYTTDEAMRTEWAMLSSERAGRGQAEAVTDERGAEAAIKRAESESGYKFNRGQNRAARGILASDNRVTAIQGYAGTAKTTSVLRATTDAAQRAGYTVVGMAPTRSAANTLTEGAGIDDTRTLASHLLSERGTSGDDERAPELWIVDEASLASARDMRDLMRASERAGARVVMVGDVAQLGSVEAGEAFGQMQDRGMETHVLDEIVRQRGDDAREAVESTIEGDARSAVEAIERSGTVTEFESADDRRSQIANDYLALSEEERQTTLVIDPTRDGRTDLNERIRDGLREQGQIATEGIDAQRLEKVDMTREAAQDARSYQTGDLVEFARDYKSQGLEKGETYTVQEVERDTVQLANEAGERVDWQPEKAGAPTVQAYREQEAELAAGDQITWTKNDHDEGLANGSRLEVEAVDGDQVQARDQGGQMHEIDTSGRDGQHWRYSYAQTAHAAQGATSERVLINADSGNEQLLNQRSVYVAVSRAKEGADVYTDSRAGFGDAIAERSGVEQTALEGVPSRDEQREEPEGERESEPEQEAAKQEQQAEGQQEQTREQEPARERDDGDREMGG